MMKVKFASPTQRINLLVLCAVFGNPPLVARFNHGFPYWVYGFMAVLAALFTWKFIPETKGLTLEELEKLWDRKS